ncbi:MAG: efflux RND transporter permease subunit [Mizugakiibacter sp.]|uniref:efflux RND transporter permease subunit n=1 Tax=Mizugakiibacter sp. TaxID=1972610 RepID=UPI0032110953
MARFFIDRPVFAWVIALLITLAGTIAIFNMPVEAYPSIAPPSINVSAGYPGASAQVIEQSVTSVIEQQLTGLDGLLYFSSTSSQSGQAQITVTFQNGTDLDIAAVQVQNQVDRAMPRLPQEVQQQGVRVQKASAGFLEVVALRASGGQYDSYALNNLVASQVLDQIQRVPGVGSANQFGSEFAMRIWLNPEKLQGYDLTATDALDAVRAQNVQVAAGAIGAQPGSGGQALTAAVTAESRFTDPQQFRDIILRANADGSVVRLGDVARVELGAYAYTHDSRVDGQPIAAFGIQLLPGANALQVADAVSNRMNELARNFPPGVNWFIPYDSSTFVRTSIEEVAKTLLEAIVLVVLVMWLFLQNVRATLIPTLVVPVALTGAFAGMWLAGFSINVLSLFGLVLAIGLVVDDAIVVVENVERIMREEGLPPKEATRKAMDQIIGAIVAITIVLAAVFVPSSLLSGSVGAIYRQFALTIAISMGLSALMALTFTPALCASLLKPVHHEPKGLAWFNRLFARISGGYLDRVGKALHHAPRWVFGYLLVIAAAVLLFWRLPSSFLPDEDQGYVLALVQLPPGATMDRTVAVEAEMTRILKRNPAVDRVLTVAGFSFIGQGDNVGLGFIRLKDWGERDVNALQFIDWANAELAKVPEARIFFSNLPTIRGLGQFGGFDFRLEDRAGQGHAKLIAARDLLLAKAARDPDLQNVRQNGLEDAPQLQLHLDRVQAQSMGVSIGDVYNALQLMLAPVYANDFFYQGRVLRVVIQADAPFRMRPEDLQHYYTKNARGGMVPLSSVIDAKWTVGSPSLDRYNGYGAVSITGSPPPGRSSGDAMRAMARIVANDLPQGFGFEWSGQSYQEILSGAQAPIVFSLSLIVVFLCLAALYESWSIPFAVMLVVALGVFGALVLTTLRGLPNDIYFKVGLIAIIGLSAKNAILIIEFAVAAQRRGMGAIAATLQACRLRFRPILMTSIAFILGVLPLAVSTGAGANSRHAIGTGVMGGMLGATLLGVLLVPVFYVVVRRMLGDRSDGTEDTGEDVIRPFD